MLVELEKVAKFPWSSRLAQVRTSFGRTAARWCGAQSAKPGKYLAFDGSQILLDLADPLSEGVAGTPRHHGLPAGVARNTDMTHALVDLPPMVIADLLGIHPKPAELWATLAGENWSECLSSLT
ncbi:hypothetical protein [Streptomyces sp. IBSBF 2806]|uniref:hypothetical protein n=1 Tax=Streptomyces sp. IBSBF 2806 TaxID=2903529 RepID=UPI002FDC5898